MSSKITNVIYLLAASGLNESDIYDALMGLREDSPEYWMSLLIDIRSEMKRGKRLFPYEEMAPRKPPARSTEDQIGYRVEKLLKIEAGLGTSDAVKQLTERLVESGLLRKEDIPPISKKTLGDWATRVSRIIPAKELLRHATLIRNKYAHSPQTDWKLG